MTQTVPIPIVGATGGHRSSQHGGELTRNMYLDVAEGSTGAHDFPGLKPMTTMPGDDRGWHIWNGMLYKLSGTKLYYVPDVGPAVFQFDVPGTERAIFADDGIAMYLVVENIIYKVSFLGVQVVTQSVVSGVQAIAYINRQFIISGDNGLFATSDVGNGSSYNALNYAEAEVSPDPLLRPYVFSQVVYMCGTKTIEIWYNTGDGNPPFARKDSALVNVGLIGKHAITNTDSFLYWLGDDRKVYQCTGASARPVNSPAFSHAVEAMAQTDAAGCICSRFVMEGQDFVLFKFSTDTWLYSETGNYWVQLADGVDLTPSAWSANAVIDCYGKNLAAVGGNVAELDLDTYTDNGNPRLRIRTLPNLNGKLLNAGRKRITVSRVGINMEVGVGLASGQGVTPVIMCQFSPDGGKTWQAEQHVYIGAMGDYAIPVDFWDFCTGYDVRVRIMCSDPVYLSIFDGEADMDIAGY